ncbi:MAG: ribonuclease HII [Ignavibacteriaceae bacterium]|nr:ribonuclease HII [Ignavibacteriaceae bacterium]
MINFDRNIAKSGFYEVLAGTDEAGRGPLAGPVVAAAVIMPLEGPVIPGINDSKKLTESERERLFDEILKTAVSVAHVTIENDEIDQLNILRASLKAMKAACSELTPSPSIILADGNRTFSCPIPVKTVVKGDAKSYNIAAASIVAKVVRDNFMKDLHDLYPHYNWAQNKGYPTREHIDAIRKYGRCEFHRKTFLVKALGETHHSSLFD